MKFIPLSVGIKRKLIEIKRSLPHIYDMTNERTMEQWMNVAGNVRWMYITRNLTCDKFERHFMRMLWYLAIYLRVKAIFCFCQSITFLLATLRCLPSIFIFVSVRQPENIISISIIWGIAVHNIVPPKRRHQKCQRSLPYRRSISCNIFLSAPATVKTFSFILGTI